MSFLFSFFTSEFALPLIGFLGGIIAVLGVWFKGRSDGLATAKRREQEATQEATHSRQEIENETQLFTDEELDNAIDPWVRG